MPKISDKITKIDVRLPNDIYAQIEKIAIDRNVPTHHRSGKPIVTPIILELISLGLEQLTTKKSHADNLSDINQINISDSEERIISHLEEKITEIISEKINELISNYDLRSISTNKQIKDVVLDNQQLLSYEEAIDKVKQWHDEGISQSKIAKKLTGNYYTSKGKTTWGHGQVGRIIKSKFSNKT